MVTGFNVAKIISASMLALAVGLLVVGSTAAQQPQPTVTDDMVNAVAKQLYCPICENVPLDVCPSEVCGQWRESIRQKLAGGWSEEEIKDHFVQQYGERILAEPPRRGLNWLIYVLPVVILLCGIFIFFRVLRTERRIERATDFGTEPRVEDHYLSRVEEELRQIEKEQ